MGAHSRAMPVPPGDVMGVVSDHPVFNKEKHVQYWLRCLRAPLPTAYTSSEANRMSLAFFTLAALDLLGVLFTRTTPSERRAHVDWLYACQHPAGGFRSFPAADAFSEPNTPATFFALNALAVLGDDLARVDRPACLAWLRRLQDRDGNFGELLAPGSGASHGGKDARYAYFAATIRWYLRRGRDAAAPDIDVAALVGNIRRSQTYDGGIAGVPHHEAHAGFAYCAMSALSLLDQSAGRDPAASLDAAFTRADLVAWLAGRLTTTIEDDDDLDAPSDAGSSTAADDHTAPDAAAAPPEHSFQKVRSMPMDLRNGLPALADLRGVAPLIARGMFPVHWTGFNGRCNKIADTCYAFWCGASLQMLNALQLVDVPHVQAYLLERTQHLIAGGFGKLPGDPPDIYHAYLGLATLAIVNGRKDDGPSLGPGIEDADEGTVGVTRLGDTDRTIRELDPALCISRSARLWVDSLPWRRDTGGTSMGDE